MQTYIVEVKIRLPVIAASCGVAATEVQKVLTKALDANPSPLLKGSALTLSAWEHDSRR